MSISVGEITMTFDENMNPNPIPIPNPNTPPRSLDLHKICPWAPKPNKKQGNVRKPDSTAKTRLFD